MFYLWCVAHSFRLVNRLCSVCSMGVYIGKTGQLSTENGQLQSEVQSQRELIEQLELDVSSLQNLSTLNRGEAEVRYLSITEFDRFPFLLTTLHAPLHLIAGVAIAIDSNRFTSKGSLTYATEKLKNRKPKNK